MQTLERPKTLRKNTIIRRPTRNKKNRKVIQHLLSLVVLALVAWVIAKLGPARILTIIGISSAILAMVLAGRVNRSLSSAHPVLRKSLTYTWLTVTLVLSASFIISGTGYVSSGSAYADLARRELVRTLSAAGLVLVLPVLAASVRLGKSIRLSLARTEKNL
ncbi:MAG TPA: hypothetical protein PLU88_15145 [Armatimonadota bacterium]|nr:hypothetical protein [Armatimonadota bacterium]HOM72000.1 hypothetical protein [Armatimonadota bacterium]HPP76454.1 hypothetical protein [Armatimonadota bacterium]